MASGKHEKRTELDLSGIFKTPYGMSGDHISTVSWPTKNGFIDNRGVEHQGSVTNGHPHRQVILQ